MPIERIVIEVSGDPTKLDSTIAQLEKLGKVDKTNAEQFKKNNDAHKTALKETGGVADRLADQFKELGNRILLAFSVDKIIEFGEAAVEAFVEAEKNAHQLAFAITNIAGGTQATVDKLIEQSEEFQKKSIFSDDSIQQAQTALATYGMTGKKIEELIPKIVDLASASGTDMVDATNSVISALDGRMTPAFKRVMGNIKLTGDAEKDFNLITEKLTKFQGAAASATETTAGRIEILKNKFDDFKETIGKGLVEGGAAAIDFFELLTGKIDAATFAYNRFQDVTIKSGEQLALNFEKNIEALAGDPTKQSAYIIASLETLSNKYDQVTASMSKATGVAYDTLKLEAEYIKIAYDNLSDYVKHMHDVNDPEKKPLVPKAKSVQDLTSALQGLETEIMSIQRAREKTRLEFLAADKKQELANSITDAKELANAQLEVDQQLNKDLADLDKQEAKEKYDNDLANLEALHTAGKLEETQYQQNLADLELRYQVTIKQIDEKAFDDRVKLMQDYVDTYNELLKLKDDAATEQLRHENEMNEIAYQYQKDEAKKQYDDGVLSEEEYNVEIDRIEEERLADLKKNLLAGDQATIDSLKLRIEAAQAAGLDTKELENELAAARNKLLEDELKTDNDIAEAHQKTQEDLAESGKKILTGFFDFIETINSALQDAIQSHIDALDTQISAQDKILDYQKTLAEQGLQNDLAFEERRASELEKKKLQEQRKLAKAKEMETFVTAVAKYTEDNPSTALAKAATLLAGMKAAEVLFAEEGARIGDASNIRTTLGSRRHRSGRDILVQAEMGERILSVEQNRRFEALGGLGLLKKPLAMQGIPDSAGSLIRELQEVKKAIQDKGEYSVNWEQIDGRFERIESKIQSGIKTVSRFQR